MTEMLNEECKMNARSFPWLDIEFVVRDWRNPIIANS